MEIVMYRRPYIFIYIFLFSPIFVLFVRDLQKTNEENSRYKIIFCLDMINRCRTNSLEGLEEIFYIK